MYLTMHKKCPYSEFSGPHFFRIFPHSDWIETRITPNTDTFVSLRIQSECGKMREKLGTE